MADPSTDLANAPWRERHPDRQLSGYYVGFDSTGCEPIDEILRAIASAASGSHSTEYWCEYGHTAWIQLAADAAAKRFRELSGEESNG